MPTQIRFLTKSRFKIGCECSSKLYFVDNPEYENTKTDNTFLKALAEGGFQVGELAKLYHEGGITIDAVIPDQALLQTNALLRQEKVVLFEPAIRFGNLLIRADILRKNGHHIELIEVKSRSFDPEEPDPFYNRRELKKGIKKLSSKWAPYLWDIAFQTFVIQKAFPEWEVTSSLLLADKTAVATVDGLNQRFLLRGGPAGKVRAEVRPGTTIADLGAPILIQVVVDDEIKLILNEGIRGIPFSEWVQNLSDSYQNKTWIPPTIGSHCKECEFRIRKSSSSDKKSGFHECWKAATHLDENQLNQPLILDIWNFKQTDRLTSQGCFLMESVNESDLPPPKTSENSNTPGLSTQKRQWIQIEKTRKRDTSPYIDREGLSTEMQSWQYPLHMIDFETTLVAIPFHRGRRPYEQIAFQFSHHKVTADWNISHQTEYIDGRIGHFPNFDFVRALKDALSQEEGTLFRYSTHENTVLCQIYDQLRRSDEPDKKELMAWIQTMTVSPENSTESWEGTRQMVDLCELVKRYYYHPAMGGSNSIKKVLPAILGSSPELQEKYAHPIYGSPSGILSKNFKNQIWFQQDPNKTLIDPYQLLPPLFKDLDLETMDSLITDGSLADGGAAMTAYSRMQFTEMSQIERDRVIQGLLRYCELDTFAMVLLVEYWRVELAKDLL